MSLISIYLFNVFHSVSTSISMGVNFFSIKDRVYSAFLNVQKKLAESVGLSVISQAVPISEEEAVHLSMQNSFLTTVEQKEAAHLLNKYDRVLEELKKLFKEKAVLKKKDFSAGVVQKAFRKYLSVRRVQKQKHAESMQLVLEEQKSKLKKIRAATVIQSAYRGHNIRSQLQRHFLPLELFEAAKSALASGTIEQFSRSSCGKTPVYFHPELPIVFKLSKNPQNRKRLQQMIEAKNVCQKNGYTSLVIPEARIHGDFIIERCLPLRDGLEQKKQIGLYIEQQEKFTKAVEEFTAFLCQTLLDDLSAQLWMGLSSVRVGRYDNVALYLDEKNEAKIGLIDLETFSPLPSKSPRGVFQSCLQAIRLFPLHFELILAVGKRFDPQIEKFEKDLQEERARLVEYFDTIYQDHRRFVEEKGIVPGGDQIIPADAEKMEDFVTSMMTLWSPISQELSKIGSYDCLATLRSLASLSPEQITVFFSSKDPTELPPFIPVEQRKEIVLSENEQQILKEKVFPEVYGMTLKFMNDLLETKLKDLDRNTPSSYPQLLYIRSLIFDEKFPPYLSFQEEFLAKLTEAVPFQNEFQKKYAFDCMIKAVFQELVRIKKIAYYNPDFGFRFSPQHCIFC